jgi:hypothetical protein
MGSGNTAEVEALGPMEEPREDAFDWQAAQRQDEEEVRESRSKKAALDKKFPAEIVARRDFLNALVKENGLIPEEDIHKLQLGGKVIPIIKRTGIEKIQYMNRISVTFEEKILERDFAVIKATAEMEGPYDTFRIETYGSALLGKGGNCTNTYLAEMAEKRAFARAVLKVVGAYKFGVYAEDEAEDFKKS